MTRLVITDLVVEQFRKFAGPTRLAGLGPGLNLLTAENEAGKSTLKAALDAVFFERHRLTGETARAMANRWNDAPPALQVAFQLDGQDYRLTKRFLRQQKALLTRPDGSLADGEAAEQEMQRLLGFDQAARGGVKAEHLGIWGLLWLNQGDSLAAVKVEDSAKGPLQESLVQGEVAAITGGRRGQRVPQAVRQALAEYLTDTGRPTGRYRNLLREMEEAETALAAANALRQELAERLDGLARTRRDLASDENAADPDAEKAAIADARAEVQAARALAGELDHAGTAVALAEQQQKSASGEAEQRAALVQAVEDQTGALTAARNEAAAIAAAAADAGRRLAQAEQQAADAADAGDAALRQHEAVRAAAARAVRQVGLDKARAALTQALAAARTAQDTRRAAEASPVTPEALKRLRALASQREVKFAARAAAATRLRFALTGEGVELDGKPVAADASHDLLRSARLSLGGLGSVEIRPGVQDAAALERDAERAEQALASALAALDAADLATAETLADRRTDLLQQSKTAGERARLLAPDHAGAGAIADALAEVEADIAAMADAGDAADLPDEDTARAAAIAATAARKNAEAAAAEARQAAALAKQRGEQAAKALSLAETQQKAAAARLAAARETAPDATVAEALPKAEAALQQAQDSLKILRQRQAEQGDAAALEARMERLEVARDRRLQRVETLKLTVARLETEIRSRSEQGPDEALADARATFDRLTQERAALERRVAALQLLDRTLAEAKSAVEAHYLAPVTARLRPHLATLFGEAALSLDSEFGLQHLQRGVREELVQDLSHGTREQLAILTRLAFAEVLAAQGRPVVLVLDDVLVFADDRRIDDMFAALEQAARHMQVIVLSCRQRLFDGLGGRGQRRLSIEPADPIEL